MAEDVGVDEFTWLRERGEKNAKGENIVIGGTSKNCGEATQVKEI